MVVDVLHGGNVAGDIQLIILAVMSKEPNIQSLNNHPLEVEPAKTQGQDDIAIGTIAPAFAAPTKDMMVTDNAGMLTAEQESEIEDMLYAINQRTGVELAVYTIETLNGQDIETKANDLFRELGLGDSEKNNGLLLLIALNDRKFRLEVGYGLEGTIPDTKAAEIINTMTPYFKESNYADGIKAAISKTENVLNGEADTTTEK